VAPGPHRAWHGCIAVNLVARSGVGVARNHGRNARLAARKRRRAARPRILQARHPDMTVIILVLAGNLMLAGLFSLVAVALD
jgi:hypothetical protein